MATPQEATGEPSFISLGIPQEKAKDQWAMLQFQLIFIEHKTLADVSLSRSERVRNLEQLVRHRLYLHPGNSTDSDTEDDPEDWRHAIIKQYEAAVAEIYKPDGRYKDLDMDGRLDAHMKLIDSIIVKAMSDKDDRWIGNVRKLRVAAGGVPFWNAEDYTEEDEERDAKAFMDTR